MPGEGGQALLILDLPVDILNLILQYLLVVPSRSVQGEGTQEKSHDESSEDETAEGKWRTSQLPSRRSIHLCPCIPSPLDPLPILLIHPSIYNLASPLFYGLNTFTLDVTGVHSIHIRSLVLPSPSRGTGGGGGGESPPTSSRIDDDANTSSDAVVLLLKQPDALRKIHKLRFRIDRLREWIHTGLQPILEDMIIRGQVNELVVEVVAKQKLSKERRNNQRGRRATGETSREEARRAWKEEGGMFARQPMAGILKLQGDPYLRTARLFVGEDHDRVWCQWHSSRGASCGRVEEGNTYHREDLVRGGGAAGESMGLVEVDWRGILGKLDPDGVHLAKEVSVQRW